MITKREHQLVSLVLETSCRLYLFPHDLERNATRGGVILVTKSSWKVVAVTINSAVSFLYGVYLLVRLHPAWGYDPSELRKLSFETLVHYFWLVVHFTCFAMQIYAIQYKLEFAYLYNQVLKFNLEGGKFSCNLLCVVEFDSFFAIGQKYYGQKYKKRTMVDTVLMAAVCQLTIVTLLFSMIFVLAPTHRHFLYSTLGHYQSWITFMVFSIMEIYLTIRAGVLDAFYLIFGYFYVISLKRWLKMAW
jgi:hypothetical protein